MPAPTLLAPLDRLTPRHLLAASAGVAVLTIALKAGAWWLTGSVGLLADALESVVNLASALFGLWMVAIAQRPADEHHPHGHHKAEYFASGFEGALIVLSAMLIAWTAWPRLFEPQALAQLDWGLGLSVLSSGLNGALAWVMLRAARVHHSMALEAEGRHLITDVWTSAGVVLGLGAAWLTGWLWLDALLALGVALNILREGAVLLWRSSQGLMDEAIEPEMMERVREVLAGFMQPALRFDHVSSRRSGSRRFVHLHLHLPPSWSLGQAAALRARVEQALMSAVPGLRATIELLPTDLEAHFGNEEDVN